MKKLLFTICLLLCAVISNATDIFNGQGQGTQSSPYEIWNLDRLNEVRNFVGDVGNAKAFGSRMGRRTDTYAFFVLYDKQQYSSEMPIWGVCRRWDTWQDMHETN